MERCLRVMGDMKSLPVPVPAPVPAPVPVLPDAVGRPTAEVTLPVLFPPQFPLHFPHFVHCASAFRAHFIVAGYAADK